MNFNSSNFSKKEVALLFIEKMFKVIKNEVKPMQKGGLLLKEYASTWSNFKSTDFINYQRIVRKYTDQYDVNECMADFIEQKNVEKNIDKIRAKQNKVFPYTIRLNVKTRSGHRIERKVVIKDISYDSEQYFVDFNISSRSNR